MSVAVRVIPCLDVDAGRVVKGVNFENLRDAGDDVDRLLRAGADKVGVNTAAIARPALIAETADRFGAQVLVLSADVRRRRDDRGEVTGGFEVTTHGGRSRTGVDAV